VAALRPGQEVDLVRACTRKERLVARSGSPYLALELRDRGGTVAGRAFRDADVLAGRFDRGASSACAPAWSASASATSSRWT